MAVWLVKKEMSISFFNGVEWGICKYKCKIITKILVYDKSLMY